MTKQLHVLFDEESCRDIEHTARTHRMTIAEWARQTRCRARLSPLERAKPNDDARIRRYEKIWQLVDRCEHLTTETNIHA